VHFYSVSSQPKTFILKIVALLLAIRHAIRHAASAIAVMFTTKLALTQSNVVYRNKFLTHEGAAEWCPNTTLYKDAEWCLNITQSPAAVKYLNILMFRNAELATESFANKLAGMFHATTGNMSVDLRLKLLAAHNWD
jgi:hypothetical protein